MIVMIVYVLLVAVGEVVAFFICQAVDSFIPSAWSMIVYMAMFFGTIWAMWPLAVYVTERWLTKSESVGHNMRTAK